MKPNLESMKVWQEVKHECLFVDMKLRGESMTPSDSELAPQEHRRRQRLTLLVAERTQTDLFVAETVTCHVTCQLLQITSPFCGAVSFPPFCI